MNGNLKKGGKGTIETAVFGGGCFWGMEIAFSKVQGVIAAESGYMGHAKYGHVSYQDICGGATGYAEIVKVSFDPAKVGYGELLEVFWKHHDPTTMNQQGPDFGTQYRSVIFYSAEEQRKKAIASRDALQKRMDKKGIKRKIVTAIETAGNYFRAEEYHQKYLEKQGQQSCHVLNPYYA